MRSQLTRSVFRQLLSNEGLLFRCPTQTTLLLRQRSRNVSIPITRAPQRRTLFGFMRKIPREPRQPELDPGIAIMLELNKYMKMNVRPPPAKELVKGWRAFFKFKESRKEPVNSALAKNVLRTFKHLKKLKGLGDKEDELSIDDIKLARKVLQWHAEDDPETFQELAREFYTECVNFSNDNRSRYSTVRWFVHVLTKTGASTEARDIVQEWLSKPSVDAPRTESPQLLWTLIISGFSQERNEEELLKTVEIAEKAGMKYTMAVHRIMTLFYARIDNVKATKEWFSRPVDDGITQAVTLYGILDFAARNNETEWCKGVFKELVQKNPDSRAIWDAIFCWAAGSIGKGVEDVERMMDVMTKRNLDRPSIKPDGNTINNLVDRTISRNDPYLAERYIALGVKKGIQPNARTYLLQMDYRIGANDLAGAQAAYEAVQSQEISKDLDLPVINKYIRALCSAQTINYDRIKSILIDLDERNKRLEPETVSSLSILYLERDETDDLIDLLQINVFHYSLPQRETIMKTFTNYCLDRENHTTRVWHAYTLLRLIFDETTTETRTQIMNEFFHRGRCDMAVHCFGHMRQHDIQAKRPILSTYIDCFVGIAQCADREHLDIVHNMMKMDVNIEPNTKLYNSLMLAYTACDDANRAMDFWDDITNSNEGPTYKSLEIVFWTCGRRPFGDVAAREIWAKMRRMEIEVTREVWAAYVGALSGNGKWVEGRDLADAGEREFGLKPDVLVIGTLYNELKGQNRKDMVEEWAKENYPDVWAELMRLGQTEDEEYGWKTFNMERKMEA